MTTFNQLLRYGRKQKPFYSRSSKLNQCPQKSGVVEQVRIMAPKKPNSAKRKVAKIKLGTGRALIAHIPGSGHNLQTHSDVLIRYGRRRDLPGVHYWLIRGKLDFTTTQKIERHNRRSKFGLKQNHRPIDEAPRVETEADRLAVQEARLAMASRMLRNMEIKEKAAVVITTTIVQAEQPVYVDNMGILWRADILKWDKERREKANITPAETKVAVEQPLKIKEPLGDQKTKD